MGQNPSKQRVGEGAKRVGAGIYSLSLSLVCQFCLLCRTLVYLSLKIHKITQKFSQIHAFCGVGVNFCLNSLKNSAHFLKFLKKFTPFFYFFSKISNFPNFFKKFTNFANFFKKFSLRLRKRQPVSQGRGKIRLFFGSVVDFRHFVKLWIWIASALKTPRNDGLWIAAVFSNRSQ